MTSQEYILVRKLKRLATPHEWSHLAELFEDSLEELRRERELQRAAIAARWQDRERIRQVRRERDLVRRERELAITQATELNDAKDRQARLENMKAHVRESLERDFLNAEHLIWTHPDAALLQKDHVADAKREVVKQWARQTLSHELDEEQLEAVATTHTNVLITARAGSGKTRTLTSRAIFLQTHCHIDPTELLIVAFNKRAADEIRKRLSDVIDGPLPHIRTFHSLAYGIVNPAETLLTDESEFETYPKSRIIQSLLDEHLDDHDLGPMIRSFMLEHFRSDWEDLALRESGLPASESIRLRHLLPRETLRGEYVKSYGEKLIANVLFKNGIDYQYERPFDWDGRRYRPDFTINTKMDRGVVIEYFGVRGDVDYDKQIVEKRSYWSRQTGWTLVELTPRDVAGDPDEFTEELLAQLDRFGIARVARSDDEIWEAIRQRVVGRFARTVETFISRSRLRGLAGDDLATLIARHHSATPTEGVYLQIAQSMFSRYARHLESSKCEDFDGLLWRAVHALQEGKTSFVQNKADQSGDMQRIRHVLIDEFQDFSNVFYELVQSINRKHLDVSFFCVGDDWQAINGFAGSDLRYFKNFGTHFLNGQHLSITRNYRSPWSIVAAGNALMVGKGGPAVAELSEQGRLVAVDLDSFTPTAVEKGRCTNRVLCPALLRVIRRCLDRGEDVVLLSRTQSVGRSWGVDGLGSEGLGDLNTLLKHLRGHLFDDERHRLTISTAHGFKGLESDAVVIVDVTQGRYPLIHPTWIFSRIFGDTLTSLEDEERKLFYVAITRAKKTLVLVTQNTRTSPFLNDLKSKCPILEPGWSSLSPANTPGPSPIEMRVYNGFNYREPLRSDGFTFVNEEKCWVRIVPEHHRILSSLTDRAWFRHPVRVELFTNGNLIAQFDAD
jgi:DNA helicase-4